MEKREDFEKLAAFIERHKLSRITFYALKPVRGTPYDHGPSTIDYAWWIARTRIRFPALQIIAGTAAARVDEVDILLRAGANAITKFPATKMFGTEKARLIEIKAASAGRDWVSNLHKLPDIDWDSQIDALDISEELKEKTKLKMRSYLEMMRNAHEKHDADVKHAVDIGLEE